MLGVLKQSGPLVFAAIELLRIGLAQLSAQGDECNQQFLAIAT